LVVMIVLKDDGEKQSRGGKHGGLYPRENALYHKSPQTKIAGKKSPDGARRYYRCFGPRKWSSEAMPYHGPS
jgi:hypothetical protein